MVQHVAWAPPLGGFPGTTHWEETPGKIQNSLVRTHWWELTAIPQNEPEDVTIRRGSYYWSSLLDMVPPSHDLG